MIVTALKVRVGSQRERETGRGGERQGEGEREQRENRERETERERQGEGEGGTVPMRMESREVLCSEESSNNPQCVRSVESAGFR
jgi:hypothetical protein